MSEFLTLLKGNKGKVSGGILIIGGILLLFFSDKCSTDFLTDSPTTILSDSTLNLQIQELNNALTLSGEQLQLANKSKDEAEFALSKRDDVISGLNSKLSRRDATIADLQANPVIREVLVPMENSEMKAQILSLSADLQSKIEENKKERAFIVNLTRQKEDSDRQARDFKRQLDAATQETKWGKVIDVPNGKLTLTGTLTGSLSDFQSTYQATQPLGTTVQLPKFISYSNSLLFGVGYQSFLGDFSDNGFINVGYKRNTKFLNHRLNVSLIGSYSDFGWDNIGGLRPSQSQLGVSLNAGFEFGKRKQ